MRFFKDARYRRLMILIFVGLLIGYVSSGLCLFRIQGDANDGVTLLAWGPPEETTPNFMFGPTESVTLNRAIGVAYRPLIRWAEGACFVYYGGAPRSFRAYDRRAWGRNSIPLGAYLWRQIRQGNVTLLR